VLVAGLFLASQLSLLSARRVDTLWTTSALLGLAYGALFGLCPSISCEWFGLGAPMSRRVAVRGRVG
jgi:hypothetical protein